MKTQAFSCPAFSKVFTPLWSSSFSHFKFWQVYWTALQSSTLPPQWVLFLSTQNPQHFSLCQTFWSKFASLRPNWLRLAVGPFAIVPWWVYDQDWVLKLPSSHLWLALTHLPLNLCLIFSFKLSNSMLSHFYCQFSKPLHRLKSRSQTALFSDNRRLYLNTSSVWSPSTSPLPFQSSRSHQPDQSHHHLYPLLQTWGSYWCNRSKCWVLPRI